MDVCSSVQKAVSLLERNTFFVVGRCQLSKENASVGSSLARSIFQFFLKLVFITAPQHHHYPLGYLCLKDP